LHDALPIYDMAVRVDQAGKQRAPASVEQVARPLRPPVAALEELLHPAFVVDDDAVEAEQAPVLAHRVAVDVVDERIRQRGNGREQSCDDEEQQTLHGSSLRTSEDVSCRAPPIACTSA